MAPFLYFVPQSSPVKFDDLAALGIAYAFDGPQITQVTCRAGPGDTGGRVLAAGDQPLIGFHPDRQTWRQIPDSPAWLGYDPNALPGPDDLKRPAQTCIYSALLGDGKSWLVPTGVFEDGESPLPKVREIQDDGSIKRRPATRFEPIYLAADKIRSHIKNQEDISDREEWDICVAALQLNYRVSDLEITALQLLDDQSVINIIYALVDRGNWADMEVTE